MAVKKSMKEWGVTNELEMLREIIQSSPFLRERVNQKLRALKESASENIFEEAVKSAEEKALKRKLDEGEAD